LGSLSLSFLAENNDFFLMIVPLKMPKEAMLQDM